MKLNVTELNTVSASGPMSGQTPNRQSQNSNTNNSQDKRNNKK